MKNQRTIFLLTLPAVLVYLWVAINFDFYQDDAYISFRYVANYLHGDGLVFNVGERVEGFTNFGWVVYLLLLGALGLDYALAAKVTGIAFGATTLVVTTMIARQLLDDRVRWLSLLPAYLIAFNLSFAYWCQAGLETAAFVFLAVLSLHLFLTRSYQLTATLTAAVLVRPEGVLLACMFLGLEVIACRRRPLFALNCCGAAFVLLIPFLLFKLAYYHSILPNPFYAKAGFDLEQVASGLEYTGRFFKHYAYFPLALLILLLLWGRLTATMRTIWLFTCLYMVYVILVGGDVLKVHRFFLPILPPASVLVVLSIHLMSARVKHGIAYLISVLVTIILLAVTYAVPRDYIAHYERMEKGLTDKFGHLARQMKKSDPSDFSAALSTIGIFSYELMGHRVIDMLGLTDSTIARHPETPVEGMESTWKERCYNSKYVLESAPDYIIFSTGRRPSSPAERALMLYQHFLRNYRTVAWNYVPGDTGASQSMVPAFKKTGPVEPPLVRTHPVEFVNYYVQGIHEARAGDYVRSQMSFLEALRLGGDPPYPLLTHKMAQNYISLRKSEIGERLLNKIVELDSTVYEAHADLYLYEYSVGDRAKAAVHRRWLESLVPWAASHFDSLAEATARQYGR